MAQFSDAKVIADYAERTLTLVPGLSTCSACRPCSWLSVHRTMGAY